jgi:hypothetical protein
MDRPFQFGLRTIFWAMLLITPLAASAHFVREELSGALPNSLAFFNLLACAAAYAVIFTMLARQRVCERGKQGRYFVLPAARTGAFYGALFMTQIAVPFIAAKLVVAYQRNQIVTNADLAKTVLELAMFIGGPLVGLLGVFLGAFGGCIAGLVLEWRQPHSG